MNKSNLAIGVFDSGVGGLTVLRALKETLPQESFIYLGDTARLPYGTKSAETVQQYAVQLARILIERQIKALVIACNTATIAALTYLQTMLNDIPILGTLTPSAKAAIESTKNNAIMILATETTVASNAYQSLLSKHLPNISINARGCSLLVALAEEGMIDNTIAKATLKHYLSGLKEEDTILLGCTHFPVFKPLLEDLLPLNVTLIDSAQPTALALKQLLIEKKLLSTNNARQNVQYLVTDSIKRFQSIGGIFLGESLKEENIELIEVGLKK